MEKIRKDKEINDKEKNRVNGELRRMVEEKEEKLKELMVESEEMNLLKN